MNSLLNRHALIEIDRSNEFLMKEVTNVTLSSDSGLRLDQPMKLLDVRLSESFSTSFNVEIRGILGVEKRLVAFGFTILRVRN